jgi:peroxiredoxin
MSKQNTNKGGAETRRTGGTPTQPVNKQTNQARSQGAGSATQKTGGKPANATAYNRAGGATRPMGGRPVYAKPKSGFRLRPLDVALVLAGVLIVAFIVFSAFQSPPVTVNPGAGVPADAVHVSVGSDAPNFTVQDIEGNNRSLSDYAGKVVVLEFMATWCPHCQAETPIYNQLYDAYVSTGKGVEVIGINATPRGYDNTSPATVNDLKTFRDKHGSKYPLMFDQSLASASAYGVNSYPTVYIVDKDGKIAMQPPTDALPTYDQLAAKVEELLNK